MRFVDAAEIKGVLTFPHLVDALEAAHRRPKIEIQDAFLGDAHYFVRHAVDRGRFMASKLITSRGAISPAPTTSSLRGSDVARTFVPSAESAAVRQ